MKEEKTIVQFLKEEMRDSIFLDDIYFDQHFVRFLEYNYD